jgi:hypothetical protein
MIDNDDVAAELLAYMARQDGVRHDAMPETALSTAGRTVTGGTPVDRSGHHGLVPCLSALLEVTSSKLRFERRQ